MLTSTKKLIPLMLILILSLAVSSCNMPGRSVSNPEETAAIQTSIAQTVMAEAGSEPAEENEETTPTDTPEPSNSDQEPTDPPPASDTPPPTETPLPCNLAEFVKDVTIPDGKKFQPGESFTKTWRLKNIGSCAWTSGYQIILDGGDSLGAPASVQLTDGTVNPGSNVDVSVELTAPDDPGTYRGNWKIKDPSDVVFGLENSSSGYFWVEIKVAEPEDPEETEVTVTLQADPAHSKTVSVGGSSSDTRLGIAPNGDALRAFIDFDLSEADGLSNGTTIQKAKLDLTNFSGASCFEFLHPLQVYQISYGAQVNYPGDFNAAPIRTLASASSEAGINQPINIKNAVQSFVDNNGAGHFQIRMELEHDDSGSAFACLMEWPNPVLKLTYLD